MLKFCRVTKVKVFFLVLLIFTCLNFRPPFWRRVYWILALFPTLFRSHKQHHATLSDHPSTCLNSLLRVYFHPGSPFPFYTCYADDLHHHWFNLLCNLRSGVPSFAAGDKWAKKSLFKNILKPRIYFLTCPFCQHLTQTKRTCLNKSLVWKKDSESLVLLVHLSPSLYFKIWSFDLSYFVRCFQAFDCGLAVIITGQRSCCFITFWGLIPY